MEARMHMTDMQSTNGLQTEANFVQFVSISQSQHGISNELLLDRVAGNFF